MAKNHLYQFMIKHFAAQVVENFYVFSFSDYIFRNEKKSNLDLFLLAAMFGPKVNSFLWGKRN
jgi:hypothetical protein